MTHLQAWSTPAHRRLIFEELFYLELGLELKRRKFKERAGIVFETNDKVREAIRQVLPFHPTAAQKRALGEIVADMRRSGPMRRLLQGDVGSGKTIVALQAMLVAIENGYQAALMAPTEILATQHYLSIRKLLENATSPGTASPIASRCSPARSTKTASAPPAARSFAAKPISSSAPTPSSRRRSSSPTSASSSSMSSIASASCSASA